MYPALIPAARCPTNLHKQPKYRAAMKARDESVELGMCSSWVKVKNAAYERQSASYPDLEHLQHAALIVRAILVSQRER